MHHELDSYLPPSPPVIQNTPLHNTNKRIPVHTEPGQYQIQSNLMNPNESFSFSLPISDCLAYGLKKREKEVTDVLGMTVVVVSFNVGGVDVVEVSNEDIARAVKRDSKKIDLLVIGLQEIVPLGIVSASSLFVDSDKYELWRKKIADVLGNDEYVFIAQKYMWGLHALVFSHVIHAPQISDVYSESVGVGLLGVGGNKGGVAIRFQLYGSTLCFINAHLAAHQEEVHMRNSDSKEILSSLQFCAISDPPKSVMFSDHDFCWFFGDLNYRVDLPITEVLSLIDTAQYDKILKADQLKGQQTLKNAFQDFEEAPIKFAPTYKFLTGEMGGLYDTAKGQKSKVPSYCDRILFLPHSGIFPIDYASIPSVNVSDHKPIRAVFKVPIRFYMIEEYERLKALLAAKIQNWHKQVCLRVSTVPLLENFKIMDDSTLLKVKTGFSSVASTVSRLTATVSTGFSYLSADKRYIDNQMISMREDEKNLFAGMCKFGYGLAGGLSGLLAKPYNGAQENGARGFLNGLGQGLGGLIGKPVAGLFNMAADAMHAAAVNSLDVDAFELIPKARMSLDGYVRLVWYQKCKKHKLVDNVVKKSLPNEMLSYYYADNQAGNVEMKRDCRILDSLREFILLSVKLNFNRIAVVFSNYRILLFLLPIEFARAVPPWMADLQQRKASLPPVVINVKKYGIVSQTESDSMAVFFKPTFGTNTIESVVNEEEEAVIINLTISRGVEMEEISYKVILLMRYTKQLDFLFFAC